MSALTATAFEQLLAYFERDEKLFPSVKSAAEKYELLRQKLVKCLTWKGCPETDADSIADTALDRVALKISKGEQIESIKAYACEVLRFVWLEYRRKHKEITVEEKDFPEAVSQPNLEIFDGEDERIRCLRTCLAKFEEKASDASKTDGGKPAPSDRYLITRYYDIDAGEKLKEIRRKLADEMGYPMNTAEEIKRSMTRLKVRAFHLRERLEKCINECVKRLTTVTKPGDSDTNNWGGSTK